MKKKEEAHLKLVLLGDANVGKTNIFNRYIYDNISRTRMVIGAYFASIKVRTKNEIYKVSIWDTAGEEKFDALTKIYTRGANCAIVCFDLTDRNTFRAIQKWAGMLDKSCVVMILGNKLEQIQKGQKKRQVTLEEIKAFAKQLGALYTQGSAVTGTGIEAAFKEVISKCIEKYGKSVEEQLEVGRPVEDRGVVTLCYGDGTSEYKCC